MTSGRSVTNDDFRSEYVVLRPHHLLKSTFFTYHLDTVSFCERSNLQTRLKVTGTLKLFYKSILYTRLKSVLYDEWRSSDFSRRLSS